MGVYTENFTFTPTLSLVSRGVIHNQANILSLREMEQLTKERSEGIAMRSRAFAHMIAYKISLSA